MSKKFLLFGFLFFLKAPISAAVTFNGTNGFVDVPTITVASTWTFTCWYTCNSTSPARTLITEDVNGTPTRIGLANGTANFTIRAISGGSLDSTIASPGRNVWVHVAVTRDLDGKVDLYINGGTPNRLYSDAAQIGNSVFSAIGRTDAVVGQYFSGQIDDVRLYNRKLSTAEIQSLAFSRCRLLITNGLLAWWKLDDGTDGMTATNSVGSEAIKDSSGNGKNGQSGSPGTITYSGSIWINYP